MIIVIIFFCFKTTKFDFFSQFQNLMYNGPSSMILLSSLIVNILRSTIQALWSDSNQREGTTMGHVSKPCVTVVKVRTFCFLIEKTNTVDTTDIYRFPICIQSKKELFPLRVLSFSQKTQFIWLDLNAKLLFKTFADSISTCKN